MAKRTYVCSKRKLFLSFVFLLLISVACLVWTVNFSTEYKTATTDSAVALKRLFRHKSKQWKRKKAERIENRNFAQKEIEILERIQNKSFVEPARKNNRPNVERKSNFKFKKKNLQNFTTRSDVILFWYTPFNEITTALEFLFTDAKIILTSNQAQVETSKCGNSRLVFDRKYERESRFIVFHAVQFDINDLPKNRTADQFYVWWSAESTASISQNVYLKDFFNLTASYRRSSDVFVPYASFTWVLKLISNPENGKNFFKQQNDLKRNYVSDEIDLKYAVKDLPKHSLAIRHQTNSNPNIHKNLKSLINKKNRLVSWIVSNCGNTESSFLRFQLSDSMLRSGLKIDQFGSCNEQNFPILSRWDPNFFELLGRYKFYLAFENSLHCHDYVTEKLWYNSLYSGVVPIIFGPSRNDIKTILPPKSYIFAEDFKSQKDLVKYLKYLDKNVTAYAEYLQWRTWVKYLDNDGEISNKHIPSLVRKYLNPRPIGFCVLSSITKPNVVHDLNKWWIDEERTECKDAELAYERFTQHFFT